MTPDDEKRLFKNALSGQLPDEAKKWSRTRFSLDGIAGFDCQVKWQNFALMGYIDPNKRVFGDGALRLPIRTNNRRLRQSAEKNRDYTTELTNSNKINLIELCLALNLEFNGTYPQDVQISSSGNERNFDFIIFKWPMDQWRHYDSALKRHDQNTTLASTHAIATVISEVLRVRVEGLQTNE
jgi:hypothetical protein